jgi:nucleotide-binding universal stress UspA family protein
MSQRVFMVPHDFTDAGATAVKHAINLAHQADAKISLLHIISKDSERAPAIEKLTAIVQEIRKTNSTAKVDAYVEKGSIFTDIGAMADNIGATMIIMGTHGARGMQKVFGSFAIKVITSTSVPFMVVQKESPVEKISSIVFPIDLTLESLQIMSIATDVARAFDAEVHLVAKKESDAAFARKLSNHFMVAEKQMQASNLKYKIEYLEGSGSLYKKIMGYCKDNGANIVAITYHTDSLLPQFDTFAQSIITNDLELPALIVNSKSVSKGYF